MRAYILFPAISLILAGLLHSSVTTAQDLIDSLVEGNIDSICAKKPNLPVTVCQEITTLAINSVRGRDVDVDSLKQTVKSGFENPAYLNSLLAKSYGDKVPLGLEFKAIDIEDGETVLGLSYSINYGFVEHDSEDSQKWRKRVELSFIANGTVVNDSDKNPRNFLDTKFRLFKSYTTRIPQQDDEFGAKLSNAAGDSAAACMVKDSHECIDAKKVLFEILDSTTDFLSSFQRYEFGVDVGIESDQDFDARQEKIGAFVAGQYEDWGSESFMGSIGIIPALRMGIDSIDPNSDTPRAAAGDDSSFYRLYTELGIFMPLGTHFDQRLAFGFSYRYYSEIDASSEVKDAGLDTYNLRTFSLTTPTGLYASYASGELPLDQKSDQTVEIGWKTYF